MNPVDPVPRHPCFKDSPIRLQDLQQWAHLVPPSGQTLLRLFGPESALVLFNRLPGYQTMVPKTPDKTPGGALTWARLVAHIGTDLMYSLASRMGSECLEVPTLEALRVERRRQALRQTFDAITAPPPAGAGLSKARAVQELCLQFAPITWRQVEIILDQPSAEPSPQNPLF